MNEVAVTIAVDEKTDPNNVSFKISYGSECLEFSIARKYIDDDEFDIAALVRDIILKKELRDE